MHFIDDEECPQCNSAKNVILRGGYYACTVCHYIWGSERSGDFSIEEELDDVA
jgi:rubredoxin